jgi:hypothetical protein
MVWLLLISSCFLPTTPALSLMAFLLLLEQVHFHPRAFVCALFSVWTVLHLVFNAFIQFLLQIWEKPLVTTLSEITSLLLTQSLIVPLHLLMKSLFLHSKHFTIWNCLYSLDYLFVCLSKPPPLVHALLNVRCMNTQTLFFSISLCTCSTGNTTQY